MSAQNSKLSNIINNPEGNDFYIIGETAYNHEGNLDYLYKMIDDIASMGLEAVKFHMLLEPDSCMQKIHPLITDSKQWLFDKEDWQKIISYAQGKELEVIILAEDSQSIDFILENDLEVAGIELHAISLNDYFLMKRLLNFNGVIILGIGGSELEEIEYAVNFFKSRGKDNLLLMYGFQGYPTNYADINLKKMSKLREALGKEVGYADHTSFDNEFNEFITVLAYPLGAKVLEKHYTPDEGVKRIDFQSAVGKEKMKKIKNYLGLIKEAVGSGSLAMSEPELNYGKIGPMKKAIVARKRIPKGKIIELGDLWYKRTQEETYLKQKQIWELIGSQAVEDIEADEIVDFSKVKFMPKDKKSKDLSYLGKIDKQG